MKIKVLSVLLILLLLILFVPTPKKKDPVKQRMVKEEETRGVFLSYIELKNYLYQKSEEESKKNIKGIITNIKKNNFNLLILQVRSFSDAIYPSKIFPSSKVVCSKEGEELDYDYLDYFLTLAHQEGIEVHTWINLYRVSSSCDTSLLSTKNPAYHLLGTSSVDVIEGKGIYYNPASEEVKRLIVSGVEEIVENYDVDGVHIDDYFYPNKTIDLVSYEESGEKDSLYNYRLGHVSDLMRRIYQAVHKKKNCVFGISPQGNIENNYETEFADVRKWGSSKGYVDYLMPQVYYGFYNEAKPYYEVVKEWNDLVVDPSVSLYFTLALYKTGVVDSFAKSGANEWIEENNILKKEVLIARGLKQYKGFSLFRYDYLVNSDLQTENTILEIENLQEVLD